MELLIYYNSLMNIYSCWQVFYYLPLWCLIIIVSCIHCIVSNPRQLQKVSKMKSGISISWNIPLKVPAFKDNCNPITYKYTVSHHVMAELWEHLLRVICRKTC